MTSFYFQKIMPSSYILFIVCLVSFGFQKNKTNDDNFEGSKYQTSVDAFLKETKYQSALEILEVAKKSYKKNNDWEAFIACGVEQSSISDNINDSIKRIYAQNTLAIAVNVLDDNSLQLGRSYQQMAEVNVLYQQYDSSLYFFEKALPVFKHHQEWETYAWALITKGVSHYYLNQISSLKKQLLKAEEVYKKHELNEEIYVTILDLFSYVYDLEGDSYRAIENNKHTIQFYQNKSQKNNTDIFFIANNYRALGLTYSNIGAYDLARNYLLEAISYYSSIDEIKEEARCYLSVSKMHHAEENYEQSIKNVQKGIELINKIPQDKNVKTTLFLQLGRSYWFSEKFDSSSLYLDLALQTANKDNIGLVELEYSNLLLLEDKSSEAIKLLDKTKSKFKSTQNDYFARLYRNLGTAYAQQKDFENAMHNFQKSLTFHDKNFTDTLNYFANPDLNQIKYPALFLVGLETKAYYLSQFNENPKNLEAALSTYELSFKWMDILLQSYSYDESRLVSNKKNRQYFERAIGIANQLYIKTKDKKYVEKAFFFAEKMKSNLLLASLQANENQSIIPQKLRSREKELSANVVYCEFQIKESKEDKNEDKTKLYQNYLRDYKRNLATFKDTLKENYPKYYKLKYSLKLATVRSIQRTLTKKEGFISYFSGDSSTYSFAITSNNSEIIPLPSTPIISDAIIDFRQGLNQPDIEISYNTFTSYNQKANLLYQLILEPSINTLPKKIKKLTIIPDGSLNYLPFEILTNKVNKKPSSDFSKMPYLLYDYQFQYGYSATLLEANEKRQNQLAINSNCLAYAPPYKDINTQPFVTRNASKNSPTVLNGTGSEIETISEYFDGTFNQSETATKANFIKEAPNYGILHLAMHGEANFENEKFANLKFTNTKKNQSEENYLLYQNEIVNLELNAQLAVLSACETGLGKYIYGEGISSLGRSFMYAGVPSVIMSLWKVDDKSTSYLMPYLYENLANGMPKDKALHQAKLTFLEQEDFAFLHPHYWAGFVAIGDVQPIKREKNFLIYWLIGGFSILILSLFLIYKKKIN